MAYRGETINNPITGESITILETTQDSDGKRLVFDCRVRPGGIPLPPHVHDTQEERFHILSGTLGVMVGGKKRVLHAGQRAVLPAKVKHQWWNAGDDEVYFRVEAIPARNLEATLEVVAGLARDGRLNSKAMPRNPFILANLGRLSESYIPVIPFWMQRMMLNMGSAFGRLLGYDPTFARYRSAVDGVDEAAQVA